MTATAVPLSKRSGAVLGLASLAGLMMFCWPLLVEVPPETRVDPPFFFLALLPVVLVVVLAEMSEGGIDSRVLALLGVLSAANALLRVVSAGTGGVELVFFLLILAGRVFGPGFGFALGCTSLFASALMTAGVGPWLPFQMLCAAWVGMGAGLLPRRVSGRWEIAMLTVYGVVAAYLYGLLMNLQGWPFNLGTVEVPDHEGSLAFDPSASLVDNLHTFAAYTLITSTGSFDTGRAITTALCLVLLGPAILTTLRRASRRAVVLPSAVDRDPEDAVVVGGGLATAVAVAGGDPERAVGRERDRAHPAVLTDEERPRPHSAAAGDGDPPQPLAP